MFAATGMLYLSGAVSADAAREPGVGFLLTPNMGNRPPAGAVWAADNGCFTRPDTYTDERFLAWIARRMEETDTPPLFAVAPDVVGDARATLERSAPMLERIRELGIPAALVAQDGLEELEVPWSTFDVLFIGGSTAWKVGPAAAALVREAKRRGKLVHAGRVNSGKRMAHFCELGADTADGTFLAYGPTVNLPRLRAWIRASRERRAAARAARLELARRGVPMFAGGGPELDAPAEGPDVEPPTSLEDRLERVAVLELELEEARLERDEAIRAELRAGASIRTVARRAGLSSAMVGRIAQGR